VAIANEAKKQKQPNPLISRLDVGLILVLIATLFTLHPLLINIGLPNGPDVLYHTYRTGEMSRSWEHGVLFPRWAEGTYFGYGSPLFHYYASLTYYIGASAMHLFNITALDALRLLIVVSMFTASTGMYFWGKQQFGRLSGVLMALAYTYAPYIVFTEPYGRGAYPELFAFALFPYVMWCFGRLWQGANGFRLSLASLSLMLLIISHNLMSLMLTVVLTGWIVWNGVVSIVADRTNWRQVIRKPIYGLLAVAGGVGLSAYFWLPVFMESSAVALGNVTAVPILNFRNNFVTLTELFEPTPLLDEGALNGLVHQLNLGVMQWLFAITGFITVIAGIRYALKQGRHDDPQLRQGVYFMLVSVACIFLMLPVSLFVWEAISPLQLMQFPWRFLGVIAFTLAVLVGMNARWIEQLSPSWQIGASAIFVVLFILNAFPSLYAPEWTNETVDASIGGYLDAELNLEQSGTTFTNEYRPVDVFSPPNATASLIADYRDGYPIDKSNVSDFVSVTPLDNNPQYMAWDIESDEPFRMEVLTYYWLGWQAQIDGEIVDVAPSPEHGLISFDAPAGVYTVEVLLAPTPARSLGNGISAITLIILLILPIAWRTSIAQVSIASLSREQITGFSVGLVIVTLSAVLFLREGIAWLNSPPGTSPAQITTSYILDDTLMIIGYDLPRDTFRSGDTLELSLHWHAREMTDIDFSSFVHISNGGIPLAQADKQGPGGRLVSVWWTPDGYIRDDYEIRLPDDMPAGTYQILVGMYTCELMPVGECGNGYRPTVTDADGNVLGDVIQLDQITVE